MNGDVDYYVGTYSINDKRKALIDFAGPYFVTGQGLLVAQERRHDQEREGPGRQDRVLGDRIHAAAEHPGTTSRTPRPSVFDLYSACVEQLINKQVDAVTTDQAILIGYAAQDPEELKVVGEPFTTEKYGVGLAKGDTAFQTFVNTMFTDGGTTWKAIFEKNLGASGMKVTQPAVEK